jgi:beta-fructofuranosidase
MPADARAQSRVPLRAVLALPDHWVWDSWIADDGDRYHLFFLQAPSALGDPDRRHRAARIGHATSSDLFEWSYLGQALGPRNGDDAVWTGSVARGEDGVWRMYVTAVASGGPIDYPQRVAMAESDDLAEWRFTDLRVEADPRLYRTVDGGASETWRDPFVFPDPGGDGWHMLITARHPTAPRLRDGVLAHARSADMRAWEVQPPLTEPDRFGQLEVAQVRVLDGTPVLTFTCGHEEQAEPAGCTTWSVAGESVTGPWDIAAAKPFRPQPDLFAAPLVQRRDGGWAFLGFQNHGVPALEIVDPIPVRLEGGELV